MQTNYFDKKDFSNFWDDNDFALKSYVEAPPAFLLKKPPPGPMIM